MWYNIYSKGVDSMTMNLDEMKNDTARKNAIREVYGKIIYDAMIAERGEENVIYIPKTIEVGGEEGATVKITGNSVVVCVGQVTNKDGFLVDAIIVIGMTVKNWNDVCNKNSRVTLALNMDDIREALKNQI